MEQELREDGSVVRKMHIVVGVIHYLLKLPRLLVLVTIEQDSISPRGVALQAISQIIVRLPFKSRCKCNLTFLEEFRHVAKLAFYVELITVI